MHLRNIPFSLLASLTIAPAFCAAHAPAIVLAAGTSLAISQTPTQQSATIPHEQYTLPNGLTVILHRDTAVPKAAINLWYRVGARNEPSGRSGFAHLFEHLMFMGTNRVPGNQFDVLMETGGGSNNASTSLDRTNYYSSGPASLLPTLLWLDADRLEDMAITMTQEKLDTQRGVVRNERRQVVENAPYMKAYEASLQLLYPKGHPYHNGVIGTHTDLEAASVQDVKDFFGSFYTPANCSLVVAGDFEIEPTKALIERLFGDLPRGNAAPQAGASTPTLDRVIRSTSFDRVQLPALMISYHSPGEFAQGDAEMNLLASLLAGGPASRLYQRLVVQEQLAAEVQASQDASSLSSVFRIMVLALPDADLAKIESIVDEELARVRSEGPSSDELARLKAQAQLSIVSSLQSLEARADRLNQYLYAWGTPDGLQRDLDRYNTASTAGVKAWANAVLRPDARLIQVVLPEEPERAASGRDQRPSDAPMAPFSPNAPDTFELPNGVEAMVFPRPGVPLIDLSLVVVPQAGAPLDDRADAGRSILMASMLSEGSGEMDGKAFAQALESLGASMDASATSETFSLDLSTLSAHADEAIALAARALSQPRMNADDFARVQRLQQESIKQSLDQPRTIAANVALRSLMGEGHPYSMPVIGSQETVASLDLADVRAAHARVLSAFKKDGGATIIIAGDITTEAARDMLMQHFGSISLPADAPVDATAQREPITTPASFSAVPTGTTPRVLVVDRPGAPQTMVMLMAPSGPFASERRVPEQLLNIILGGSFTSRLNQNLRETHSYTYGARSAFSPRRSLGTFSAAAAVQTQVTGKAAKELLAELRRISSGDISQDEANKATQTFTADIVSSFGTLGGITGRAAGLVSLDSPWGSIASDIKTASTSNASMLNEVANGSVDLSRAVLVFVGEKEEILSQLADPELALGLPTPVVVDARGKPE